MHAADKASKEWHLDKFFRTFAALELDMLKGKQFQDRIALRLGDADAPEEGGGQTSGRLTVEDRSLKGACQNAVVLSVMMLSEDSNLRLMNSVLSVGLVVKSCHTEQVKELRSVDGSQAWLTRQIAEGGYIEHIQKALAHNVLGESGLHRRCWDGQESRGRCQLDRG